jgi:hypothetical protein
MRLLVGVSDDRRLLFTGSPSEPILALAAASLLHEDQDDLWKALRTLNRMLSGGELSRGTFGELAGRMIVILARDFGTRGDETLRPMFDANLAKGVDLLMPITVKDFIDNMLHPVPWYQIGARGSTSMENPDAKLQAAYKAIVATVGEAVINLVQFVRTLDDLPKASLDSSW